MNDRTPHLLTVSSVNREYFGGEITDEAIYNAIREKRFPGIRVGRRVFVPRLALEEFLADGGRALPGGWRREVAS